jgi:integrase
VTIQQHRGRWLVTVNRASALKGYTRIRRYVTSQTEAETLEADISKSIDTYGKWPVDPSDQPLRIPSAHRKSAASVHKPQRRQGSLREAATLALDTHWYGQQYHKQVSYLVWKVVDFFEARHCGDIDAITSEDIDALVHWGREKDLAPSSLNKYLGALRVINTVALKRRPPLATVTLPIPHLAKRRVEKWWLRPDDHQKVVQELRNPISGQLVTDPLFADLIDIICYQGFRIEELLRIEPRMLLGLETPEPWIQVPGTKTEDAQNSIPIYAEAVAPFKSALARAKHNGWTRLFPLTPRQTQDRWNDVRDFLGAQDIPTATLKSLRRTFAWYANSKGMPTSTLQKVLRHRGIGTTAGYLELVGDGSLADSRKYFSAVPTTTPQVARPVDGVGEIVKAYAATGATPEEIGRLVKELMV